ncbi:MAG: hypothetical protein MUQ10_17250, partial [Anaerolineae bacterium]|nr:hypothetical protein [Anaerolineae bacterium]
MRSDMPHNSNVPNRQQGRRHRSRLHLFWQMLAAFTLVTLLATAGIAAAGRKAIDHLQYFIRDNPWVLASIWQDRLTDYFVAEGGWEGVDGMIAGYPDGEGWDPDAPDWLPDYTLATTDGVIIAATRAGRVGESLSGSECEFAIPVTVDESSVGLLLLSPFATLGLDGFPTAARFAWQGFLRLGVAVAVVSLVMGLAFSRRVSLPLSRLTAATRSVADGDLSVR